MAYRYRSYSLLRRILIVFSVLFLVSTFFFLIVKFIERPSFTIVKSYSSAKLIASISDKVDKAIMEIERVDLIKINYPYISKPKEICLNYYQVFDRNGTLIAEDFERKVCISSEYEMVYGKDIEIRKAENLISILGNPLRISIKNTFDFPSIVEIYINVKKLAGKNCDVTRNGILISQNASYFYDSYLISPFGNLEYILYCAQ